MNLTTDKTITNTFQDFTKAALILKNFNLNSGKAGSKILKDAENLYGNRSEKILIDLRSLKDISIDFIKINDWSLDFLCDFIVSNHHKYIRKMLPKILSACKVNSGKKHKEFNLFKELTQLKNDLEFHMQKEEKLLFPYIKKLNKIFNDKAEYEIPPFGSILNLIKVIEKEHSIAGKSLIKIEKICSGSNAGTNVHGSKKILNDYLSEFDTDFHFHIHLENNILFPKAISLEKKLKKISNNHEK